MGQIASYFKRRENDDFETILNELEDSIRTKEENLAFIRQRERRAIVLFTSYSILIWLLYAVVWWFGALDWGEKKLLHDGGDAEQDIGEDELLTRIAKTIPVGAIPVLIFFTRRIVKSWYTRKQNAENKQLTSLRKKQKDQIDKLKKLSNYDKITEMLERHGQVPPRASFGGAGGLPGTPARQSGPNSKVGSAYSTPVGAAGAKSPFGFGAGQMQHLTPAQQRAIASSQQKGQHQQPTPAGLKAGMNPMAQQQGMQKQQPLNRKLFPAPPGPGGAPNAAFGRSVDASLMDVNNALMDINNMTPPHQPKTFIDKIADVLLGGDEQSPASKYALICQKCFAHNGLCLKDEVMDVQFVCPRCGHFNPSRRARITGSSGLSRPSSGQGHHREQQTTSKDPDESIGADESMNLNSPTTHIHPNSRRGAASDQQQQQETGEHDNDVSMDEDLIDDETKDKLTSEMNADEKKENLRRRAGRNSQRTGSEEAE